MEYDIRTILYPTDLSPKAAEVAKHALGIARRFDAKIQVIHVVEPLNQFANTLVERYLPKDSIDTLRTQAMEEAREELEATAQRFFEQEVFESADAKEFFADIRVVEGPPARTILKEAERLNADLIVLGDKGYNPLSEMLMGSVAQKVAMNSTTPVLLVPIRL